MASKRQLTRVQAQHQILEKYGLLIDFDGPGPTVIPKSLKNSLDESWKAWSVRVLGPDVENIRVYLARPDIPGQTRTKSLAKQGPAEPIKSLMKNQKKSLTDRLVRKQILSADKAQRARTNLEQQKAQVEAGLKRLSAAENSSRLNKFVDDLEARLAQDAMKRPDQALDTLVRDRAQQVLDAARSGRSLIDLVWDVLLYSSKCRRALSSTVPSPSPSNGG